MCTVLCNAEVFIGGRVGVTVVNDLTPYGVVNPFVSFTPCQNDRVAFDIVVQSEIIFMDGSPLSISGVAPCLRMKLSDNLELLTDLGIFGITAYEGEVSPALAIKNLNVGATINYIIPKKEKK